MEFWLISVPKEKEGSLFNQIKDKLTKPNYLCECAKFSVPHDFKVGTLDTLVSLSDELAKLDMFADLITRKLVQCMNDTLEDHKSRLTDHLTIKKESINMYVSKFEWDAGKFPINKSLAQIASILSEHLSNIDNGLKDKFLAYNQLKGTLQSLERKQMGSLLTRNLSYLVTKDDFVADSEYLVTLLVIVPRIYTELWRSKYETLTGYVVPRSSQLLHEDLEHGLWTVTLFRKMVNDFIQAAKEHRFFAREFVYNEKEIDDSKNEIKKLRKEKLETSELTFFWMKIHFGEAFIALVHVKTMRIFVESVLRYGLPVNFVYLQIKPIKKNQKRIRAILEQMFCHLESSAMTLTNEDDALLGGHMMPSTEYFPYVNVTLETNFAEVIY